MAAWFNLDLLTAVTTLFSAIYGVYAVATDFHETKNGKSVLTRAGRIGVAMLIVSAILNMSAEHFKKQEAAKQERAQIDLLTDAVNKAHEISAKLGETENEVEDASKAIKTTAQTTDTVLQTSRRTLTPLSDFTVDAEIAIPLSQEGLKSYGHRIQQEIAPSVLELEKVQIGIGKEYIRPRVDRRLNATFYDPYNRRLRPHDSEEYRVSFGSNSILSPNESEPQFFLHDEFEISLSFYHSNRVREIIRDSKTGPDSGLDMSVMQLKESSKISYAPGIGSIVIGFSAAPDISSQSESFASSLDLPGSLVKIYISGPTSDWILVPTVCLHFGKGHSLLLDKNCKQVDKREFICRVQKTDLE